MITAITSGFLIGLFGSFHCVGMCGPLALALPINTTNKAKRLLATSLYNLGRLTAYTSIGLLFGLIGQKIFLGTLQQKISIAIGVAILLFVLVEYVFKGFSKILFLNGFYKIIKEKLAVIYSKKEASFYNIFLIGLLNGYLPCGLVYAGVAAATATGSIVNGALLMMAFGLGTFPIMTVLIFSKQWITLNVRNAMRKATPIVLSIMAVLLILRGMNLGIPYLSPLIQQTEQGTQTSCCHEE